MSTTLTEAEQFFYDHAGWSYLPGTETEEEGRRRGARVLAEAEQALKTREFFVSIEADDHPWDGDVPYDGPLWVVLLWSVEGTDTPYLVGSMGSVACELGDPYLRVIAAELAEEHLYTERQMRQEAGQ